eukprot:GILI01008009.1.p1 GENE.GILI01008009.1~~GILI01008009.1.p1  ORF type:complete len:467 (+),score=75.34 GILI01008009.1:107-1507(+)
MSSSSASSSPPSLSTQAISVLDNDPDIIIPPLLQQSDVVPRGTTRPVLIEMWNNTCAFAKESGYNQRQIQSAVGKNFIVHINCDSLLHSTTLDHSLRFHPFIEWPKFLGEIFTGAQGHPLCLSFCEFVIPYRWTHQLSKEFFGVFDLAKTIELYGEDMGVAPAHTPDWGGLFSFLLLHGYTRMAFCAPACLTMGKHWGNAIFFHTSVSVDLGCIRPIHYPRSLENGKIMIHEMRCAIQADVRVPGYSTPLRLFATHLDVWDFTHQTCAQQARILAGHMKASPYPSLAVGDFNAIYRHAYDERELDILRKNNRGNSLNLVAMDQFEGVASVLTGKYKAEVWSNRCVTHACYRDVSDGSSTPSSSSSPPSSSSPSSPSSDTTSLTRSPRAPTARFVFNTITDHATLLVVFPNPSSSADTPSSAPALTSASAFVSASSSGPSAPSSMMVSSSSDTSADALTSALESTTP